MHFEETIQYMFDQHPILFTERWQCLNHLFCVIGNGYEWVNGQLVDTDHKKIPVLLGADGKASLNIEKAKKDLEAFYEDVYERIKVKKEEYVRMNVEEELYEKPFEEKEALFKKHSVYNEEELINRLTEEIVYATINKEIQEKVYQHLQPKTIQFYPLSTSSFLFQLPDNIQPDWLDGAKETATLLLSHRNEDRSNMNAFMMSQYEDTTRLLHQLANSF